jgi:hypothetical protein
MLARWLIEQREKSVPAAADNLEPEPADCASRTPSDNVLVDRVPCRARRAAIPEISTNFRRSFLEFVVFFARTLFTSSVP